LNRYNKYRPWSRWDVALFCSPVHPIGQLVEENGHVYCTSNCEAPVLPSAKKDSVSKLSATARKFHLISATTRMKLLNYDPASSWSPMSRFLRQLARVLWFRAGRDSILAAMRRGEYRYLLFRIPDAFVEVIATWAIMIFPFLLLLYSAFVFACQPVM
jgi:hypothetical protein